MLGTKLRIVVGYPGQNDAFLAMERGELDGYPAIFYSALTSTRPTWIPEGKVDLLVQYGDAPEKAIGPTPFLADLVKDPQDKLLVEAAVAPLAFGRPYLAPPGTPPERVAALRKALMETFADPEFLADAERTQLGITGPRTGEQLQKQLEAAYRTRRPSSSACASSPSNRRGNAALAARGGGRVVLGAVLWACWLG